MGVGYFSTAVLNRLRVSYKEFEGDCPFRSLYTAAECYVFGERLLNAHNARKADSQRIGTVRKLPSFVEVLPDRSHETLSRYPPLSVDL